MPVLHAQILAAQHLPQRETASPGRKERCLACREHIEPNVVHFTKTHPRCLVGPTEFESVTPEASAPKGGSNQSLGRLPSMTCGKFLRFRTLLESFVRTLNKLRTLSALYGLNSFIMMELAVEQNPFPKQEMFDAFPAKNRFELVNAFI